MKVENYYSETINLLCDGYADNLTDDEFIELLKSIHEDDKFKTRVLWDILNEAQQRVSIDCTRDLERMYLIFETLELERAENERGGNNEN